MKTKLYCLFITLTLLAGIHQAVAQNWDNWHPLGNNAVRQLCTSSRQHLLDLEVSKYCTATITYMDFYITDSTGQHTDVLPGNLAPGAIIGGWAAFTAVSPPTILVKTIQWANSSSDSISANTTVTSQQLQQQQAAQEAQQLIQQQQALLQQQRAAQQTRQQQIVNNAYAGVAANNNAAQAVNNAVGTIANVLEQQQQEKEQRAEDQANEQAKVAANSGNFADIVKAWRADPDYQQFLSDYASANSGAGFSADPDQLTDASVDLDTHHKIGRDLDNEAHSFTDWKKTPISLQNSASYGSSLSMSQTLEQINSLLTIHLDGSLDNTSVGGTFQINSIDNSGLCISYTAGYIEDALNHNQGQFRSTTFLAWKDIDTSKIHVDIVGVGVGNYHWTRLAYEISFAPKSGSDFPHKLERTASPYGDDLSQPPSCDYTKFIYRRGSTGLFLASRIFAEHLIGLVTRAAQLASSTPAGTGISASPTAQQAQPASATPQQLQLSGASGPVSISPTAERRVNSILLQRKLQSNLTDDQVMKIKPLLERYEQELLNISSDQSLSAADNFAKRSAMRTNFNQKLKDILTPDQFAKWQAFTPRRPQTLQADNSQPQQSQTTTATATPQSDISQTQPASITTTAQPRQSALPASIQTITGNGNPIDALNEQLHDCTVGMWSPGDSYSYWPGAFKATLVDNKIEFLAEGHFSNASATPYRYAITVALSDLTPDSVSVLTDKENKWTTTLLIGNTQSGRPVHLQQDLPVWLATNKQGQYVSITIQDNSKIKPMYDFLKATLSQLIQQSQGLGAGISPQPAVPQTDNSQTQSTAQNPPEIFLNQIAPQLNLTDDQKLKFKAILDKYYALVVEEGSQGKSFSKERKRRTYRNKKFPAPRSIQDIF